MVGFRIGALLRRSTVAHKVFKIRIIVEAQIKITPYKLHIISAIYIIHVNSTPQTAKLAFSSLDQQNKVIDIQ